MAWETDGASITGIALGPDGTIHAATEAARRNTPIRWWP
jgi:hypothetical protein